MTTFVQFTPSATSNFSFQATFDGQSYALTCTWNYYGQRYYVSCSTIQGDPVYTLPLIASPPEYNINLNNGYFSTPFIFRDLSQTFEVG